MARGSLERLLPMLNIAQDELFLNREAIIGATFAVILDNVVRAFRGRAVFPLSEVALAVIAELTKLGLFAASKTPDAFAHLAAATLGDITPI